MSDERALTMADDVSLKEHIEALLREQDRRTEQRFDAHDKALQVALDAATTVRGVVGLIVGLIGSIIGVLGFLYALVHTVK